MSLLSACRAGLARCTCASARVAGTSRPVRPLSTARARRRSPEPEPIPYTPETIVSPPLPPRLGKNGPLPPLKATVPKKCGPRRLPKPAQPIEGVPKKRRSTRHVSFEERHGTMHYKTRKALGEMEGMTQGDLEKAGKVVQVLQEGWPAGGEAQGQLPQLPVPDTWDQNLKVGAGTKYHVLLKDPGRARLVVANWLRDGSGELRKKDATFKDVLTSQWAPPVITTPDGGGGGEGKVIIEPYAGVGSLTRALLEHPPSVVKRVIAIEDSPGLLPFLEPLAAADPRLHIIRANPFRWETYSDLMASPLMADVARHPWEEVHPGLQLMCRMPLTIGSEQLMSQFLRFAPNRAWLFQYGRLPMGFLLPYSLWDRLSAKPLDPTRCKLTVMTEATCHTRLSLPLATLQPYAAHFHPSPSQQDLRRAQTAVHISDITARNKGKQLGHPYVSASFTPRTEQVVRRAGLDHWDYVTRMMFVSRAQPVSEAIDRLGLGGKSLLKQLKFDTSKLVKELEVHEWTQVVDAFVDWPFAPSVYMIQGMLEDVDAVRSSKA